MVRIEEFQADCEGLSWIVRADRKAGVRHMDMPLAMTI
jgi:hypothetical protein